MTAPPEHLKAIRLASKISEAPPEPGLVQMYYEVRMKNPDKFLKTLQDEERAYMMSQKDGNVAGVDVGTEKAIEMCEKWLKDRAAQVKPT